MKKAYGISTLCTLLLLLLTGPALAQPFSGCGRTADEATRVETARSLLKVNDRPGDVDHYDTVINYWAEDVTYIEPIFTNTGRDEMYDYLKKMFGGTIYGFPDDKELEIKEEVYQTYPDDSMTYMATVQWSGTFGSEYYFQTGMSIIKFQPGEGCPSYHRDYYSEGDTWFNVPGVYNTTITKICRNFYISMFDLTDRCFDEDGDGYSKYVSSTGCANRGLDCNDFVPGINPGATEILGNGIDDDCNPYTPDSGPLCFIGTIAF